MNKMNKGALIGSLLAVVMLVGVAARYEDFSATWIRVKNLKKLGSNTSITVDDPISLSGALSLGDDLTLENSETIGNDTDGTVLVSCEDDESLILEAKSPNTSNGAVTIALTGDDDGDAGDKFGVKNNGQGTLSIQSDASVKGTLADKITISSAGNVDITAGSLDVGGVVTTDADVNNDATGGSTGDPDFDVDGYAKFNGTTEFDGAIDADSTMVVDGDTDFAATGGSSGSADFDVAGYAQFAGVVETDADVNNDATGGSTGDPDFDVDGYAKFNGTSEFDGDIHADGNIVGDGSTIATNLISVWATTVEPNSATTLLVGPSLATKLELADTGVETEIQGTLDAQEEATFTANIVANGNIVGDGATVLTNGVIESCTLGALVPSTVAATTISASSTLDVNGAITCTNITVDAGASIDFGDNSVTNVGTLFVATDIYAGGSQGVTTNITLITNSGATTNVFGFTDGILTSYSE